MDTLSPSPHPYTLQVTGSSAQPALHCTSLPYPPPLPHLESSSSLSLSLCGNNTSTYTQLNHPSSSSLISPSPSPPTLPTPPPTHARYNGFPPDTPGSVRPPARSLLHREYTNTSSHTQLGTATKLWDSWDGVLAATSVTDARPALAADTQQPLPDTPETIAEVPGTPHRAS